MSTRRSGPGCFGYGCLIAIVLFSLAIGGIAWWGIRSTRHAVHQYTAESAQSLTVSRADPAEGESAARKAESLREAVANGSQFSERFTQGEVRALIQSTSWCDKVDLAFSGSEIHVQFAFPLSAVGEWQAARTFVGDIAERWATGSAKGALSVQDGNPKLVLSELVLANNELGDMARGHAAEWITGAISAGMQVPASLQGGSETADDTLISRIQTLKLENGQLVLELHKR